MGKICLRAGAATLTLIAVPATAYAQSRAPTAATPDDSAPQTDQAGAIPDIVIPDIIVTATRSATNLQTTPVAVTALSGDTLRQRGVTSLLDVQNSTPSLTVSSRSNTGSTSGGFTIRGIGVDAQNSSSAVGLYVDEVYYPAAAGNLLGLFDVDRVEVLRGPQGTLFGRNTIAGAIQYVTVKPSQELNGFVTGTYGSYDHVEIGGAINVPITGTLAIRASGRYNRDGGFVYDELNGFKRGREETKQGRLALHWQPDPALTVDLKGEVLNLKGNGRALAVTAFNSSLNPPGTPNGGASLVFAALGFGLNPAQLFTVRPDGRNYRTGGFNGADSQDFDFRTGQANIAWRIADNATLKSISAYSFSRNHSLADFDNTPVPIISGGRGIVTDKLFTQEIQLTGVALGGKLHYTLGGYYFNQSATTKDQYAIFGPGGLVIPTTSGDVKNKVNAKAAYGQLTYEIIDRLSATAGLRYSTEDVTGSFLNARFPNPASPGNPVVGPPLFASNKNHFQDLSPSFGLNFQANPDLLFYAKASKGFRAGGVAVNGNLVNPAPPASAITATPGYLPYGEETAWTYEIGTRAQFLDHRIRINPTIFYTDWKDIQFNSFLFNPNPNVITRNAGDARIWGVELEWQAAVSSRFQINGSFSYLNGKYTRVEPTVAVTLNSRLQHLPQIKFSLGARYTVPLAGDSKIVAAFDYAFTDDQQSAVTDTDFIEQPGYGLLNGRLTYDVNNRLSIAVYGKNLTDQYYYIGGVNGFATFGSVEGDLGRPREFGVTVRVRY